MRYPDQAGKKEMATAEEARERERELAQVRRPSQLTFVVLVEAV